MKQITHSLFAKVVAIFLFVISGILLTTGIISILYISDENLYSSAKVSFSGTGWEHSISQRYMERVVNEYFPLEIENEQIEPSFLNRSALERMEKQFRSDSTNFMFEIVDGNGKILLSNCTEEELETQVEYIYTKPVYHYYYDWTIGDEEESGASSQKNVISTYTMNFYFDGVNTTVFMNEYSIHFGMRSPIAIEDDYYVPARVFEELYALRYWIITFSIAALFLMLIAFIFLMCAAGHRKGYEEVRPNVQDRIPLDFYLCVVAGLTALGISAYAEIMENTNSFLIMAIATVSIASICLIFLIAVTMSVANRLKMRTFFSNTVCWMILRICWKITKAACNGIVLWFRNFPLIVRRMLEFALFLFANLIFSVMAFDDSSLSGIGAFLWILMHLTILCIVSIRAIQFYQLKKGAEKIAAGEKDYRVQSVNMYGDYKSFGEDINHIGDGIEKAVDIQVKSERMKAELITNVSHDIKTPLTSIINYVDLLKKENITNPTAEEYIGILDRQSARLKKLTEDLLEASKASTGNIQVEIAPTNIVELLNQSVAEYSERLAKNGLTPVINAVEEDAVIPADGRLLWRVFDNLLSNVCKYSQENTRVYFDITSPSAESICVTVKNISRDILNINASELKERFVRGDTARHTEGSGLGLSIAESLTELQGGRFDLIVDGDLFKAKVTFPRMIQNQNKEQEQSSIEMVEVPDK